MHLEAGLNRLRLRAFRGDEIPRPDLRRLFESLQEMVGEDGRFAFARLGPLAYLRSNEPIVTSSVSPAAIDGREPGDFMPAGEAAAAHDRLLGELQMALHDHEVNRSLQQQASERSTRSGSGVAGRRPSRRCGRCRRCFRMTR